MRAKRLLKKFTYINNKIPNSQLINYLLLHKNIKYNYGEIIQIVIVNFTQKENIIILLLIHIILKIKIYIIKSKDFLNI